jgi:hypothetical protein
MACDGKTYIPNPPRLWNRVQLPCSTYNLSPMQYNEYLMKQKGNILQYKNNSSCFTKKQIYSLMAQKKWTNRNTTWATQNDQGYTNPNSKSLKRNNTTNIIISGPVIIETSLPITCPYVPSTQINVLPNNEQSQGGEGDGPNPELPPVEPESGGGGTALPFTPNEDVPTEPIVVPDYGTLSCNITENPCTLYSETKQANQFYHPTSDSNVPGKIELLYWDENTQTWYPRQQRVMNTSDNKWPYTSGPPTDPTYIAATSYP